MRWLLILFLGVALSTQADVLRSQLTSEVQNREPVDNLHDEVVGRAGQITTAIFFTHIENRKNQQVVHKWLYQGELMAEVTFDIGSHSWRTWSSKDFLPRWQGDWQVQVWVGEQMLLSKDFQFTVAMENY
ncbi:DUF2914 domain-containing protein [Lacimicrobium alkaliphilum]|uniref:DUF2914 domain-containing protein n=1 Tax=Lacimicrobium alkaliphilum TaxID=1526571 RepID=A0A0U2ZAJ4_9ALTE|nr:DUF2914 domain-containing protein [Lacimicrobium alkaliphilum]ALS99923.1 hypothetical protein AT746_17735 [Lacimicrobium alkaliphilum]